MDKSPQQSHQSTDRLLREKTAFIRATWWALLGLALLVLVLAAVAPWVGAAARYWLYGIGSFVGVGIAIGHNILADWFVYKASPYVRLGFVKWLKHDLLGEWPMDGDLY